MKKKKKFVVVIFILIMLVLFVFQRELLKNILGISLILSPFVIIIWALTHKWKDNYTPVKGDDCIFDDDENMDNSYDIQRKVSHIEKRTTTTNTNTTVTTETIYFKGE
jgi:hypothetical protein